jgi:anti-anti-sigma factor
MTYWPKVTKFRELGKFPLKGYSAVLFDEIVAEGGVEYRFLLTVFEPDAPQPRLIVSSEVNRLANLGGGSHFLCVFPGEGHENLGASDDWGNREKFTKAALAAAAERLGLAPAGSGPTFRPQPPKPGSVAEALSPRPATIVPLQIRERESGDVLILEIEGDLAYSTFETMDSRVAHILSTGASKIVIDLWKARTVASGGWGLFINLSDKLRAKGGGLSIARPSSTHRVVVDAMSLRGFFAVCDTVEEAVRALGG